MSMTERVAEEVRALMGRHEVSQVQLTQVLHVSQTAVSKRLRGLTPFDVNEIGLLADYFHVDAADLLGTAETPNPSTPGRKTTRRYVRYLAAA